MSKPKKTPPAKDGATYPRLETRPLTDLLPNERNPRTITPEALARLQRSLEQLGNLSPVVFNVRSGKLVSGHQRVKCMVAMGQTETAVWCVDLDEKQETAALLRLNNADGEWDVERLKGVLDELGDVDLAGFTEDGLLRLCGEPTEPPEDFNEVGEGIETQYACPKCSYVWSGKAK